MPARRTLPRDPLLGRWGGLLRAYRERSELSRAELGARLEPPVGLPTVWRWEAGQREPRRHYRAQLARVLGTTTSILFPGDEEG